MSVLIIIFPILIENRFAVDEDLFIISRLLFLIIFSTLFAIRKPIVLNQLTKELNFGNYMKTEFFNSKSLAEFLIFLPRISNTLSSTAEASAKSDVMIVEGLNGLG